MIYACCDTPRRNKIAEIGTINGIDYLEVIDTELSSSDALRQRILLVYCINPIGSQPSSALSTGNVRVLGGERIKNIVVQWAAPAAMTPAPPGLSADPNLATLISKLPKEDIGKVLVVCTDVAGDFSTYTLSLVVSPLDGGAPPGFDPQSCSMDFSFQAERPSDFDCASPSNYSPAVANDAPDIDYLAKDYSTFRSLLLSRLAQLVPQWQQSSVADTGIAVAELLAYAGDQLSYQQDAIATEAYLGTARRRVSLRRHALLVDYPMHDGCNSRAWLHLCIKEGQSYSLPLIGTQFLTLLQGFPVPIEAGSAQLASALQFAPQVFEPLLDPRFAPSYVQTLYAEHNRMPFYTWGGSRCYLPAGSTQATLAGNFSNLKAGDALLFEEVRGPNTGTRNAADPSHRQVVRLTTVSADQLDPVYSTATQPVPVTTISWAAADALTFDLCISSMTDTDHSSILINDVNDVSVARGNMVLVDHGNTIGVTNPEQLGTVPQPTLYLAPGFVADRCNPAASTAIPPRFRPQLAQLPLTQAAGQFITTATGAMGTAPVPYDPAAAVAQVFDWTMDQVLPQLAVNSSLGTRNARWQSQRSLLNSAADATDFVVEVDDDGDAQLRFGDDEHGQRPDSGTSFTAIYRVGNGTAGNVGAESIAHIVGAGADVSLVTKVRNPLPAAGGVDPETADSVRRNAPQAFRTQERAVTMDDYATLAARDPRVNRTTSTRRWTGCCYTVFTTVDPRDGVDATALKADLASSLELYRMAGQDLQLNNPSYVSLEIDLLVDVQDDYFRSDVRQALLQVLGNGPQGLFNADNFSFGQTVYLSSVYAAAHQVSGVASVKVGTFQRYGISDSTALDKGKMVLGRQEIARLDNDPNFPEHGVLQLTFMGGK